MMFRALRADEIECRVQQIRQGKKDPNKKYVQLLLYKDATKKYWTKLLEK